MAKGDRYDVFVVQESKQVNEDGSPKTFWKEVGVAFENSDGSLGLRLHLLPDVTMQVRRHIVRDDREERREAPRGGNRSTQGNRNTNTGRGGGR